METKVVKDTTKKDSSMPGFFACILGGFTIGASYGIMKYFWSERGNTMNSPKKKKEEKVHQHKKLEKNGSIITFGFPHPIDLNHKTKTTQTTHDETIKLARTVLLKKASQRRDLLNGD